MTETTDPKEEGPEYVFNVIVLGDGAVGKTSLVRHFCEGFFQEHYKVTLGVECLKKKVSFRPAPDRPPVPVTLMVWDVAGQHKFAFMRANYYSHAQGALILFDVTNLHTFAHLADWKEELQQARPGVPFVVVGNKIDLKHEHEDVERRLAHLAGQFGVDYIFASAKLGTGMNEAFDAIVGKIYSREAGR
ncbi:MAG: Rab family GTPase [Promethearchaeota archaeon]